METGGFDLKKAALYAIAYLAFLVFSFNFLYKLHVDEPCYNWQIFLGYPLLTSAALALYAYAKKMSLLSISSAFFLNMK